MHSFSFFGLSGPSGQSGQHEHCSVADSNNRTATTITVTIAVTV